MMFPNTLSVLQWSSIVVLSSKNYDGVHFVKQIFFGDHTPPQNPPKNSSKCLLWLIVCRSYCHRHSLLLTHPPYSLKKRLLKLSANFVCPLSLSTFRTTSHSVHKCIAFVRDSRYCVFLQFSSLLSCLPSCHIFLRSSPGPGPSNFTIIDKTRMQTLLLCFPVLNYHVNLCNLRCLWGAILATQVNLRCQKMVPMNLPCPKTRGYTPKSRF